MSIETRSPSRRALLAAMAAAPAAGLLVPDAASASEVGLPAYLPAAGDRLGAVDVFTPDNAFAMLEYLRIDVGLLGPFAVRP